MRFILRRLARLATGGTRRGLMLERSAGYSRLHCAARSGGRVGKLTALPSVRSVQTMPTSQSTKRASAPTSSPALLVAPEIAPAGYRPPRAEPVERFVEKSPELAAHVGNAEPLAGLRGRQPTPQQRRVRAGGSAPLRRRGGEPGRKQSSGLFSPGERPATGRRGLQGHGFWQRAGALRRLTRGRCSSAAPKGREASSAARPRAEHRSAVAVPRDRRSEALTPARTRLCRTDRGLLCVHETLRTPRKIACRTTQEPPR